jgi:hypothetical protein
VVIRGFMVPTEAVVVNGVNVASGTEAVFPQVIHGALAGAQYTTIIALTNASTSSQAVTLTFSPDGGAPITVNRVLSPAGALRETAQSLFGLPTGFQSGWVRAAGTGSIAGLALYAETAAGALAVVNAGNAQSHLFFSHIADGPGKSAHWLPLAMVSCWLSVVP